MCFSFILHQTRNLFSIPFGSSPCMMYSKFRVNGCHPLQLPEDDGNGAETCRSNIRLYLYIPKVHLLVTRMNNLITSTYLTCCYLPPLSIGFRQKLTVAQLVQILTNFMEPEISLPC
jgi:hypothetical protein